MMTRATPFILAAGLALSATAATAADWSAEFFAGRGTQGTLAYGGTDYELKQGSVTGVGLWHDYGQIEAGIELTHASNGWVGYPTETQIGLSAMLSGRLTLVEEGAFTAYIGAGVGPVRVTYDYSSGSDHGWTWGGQISLGMRYAVTDKLAIFGEVRAMDTFSDAVIDGDAVEYLRRDVVIGVRQSF